MKRYNIDGQLHVSEVDNGYWVKAEDMEFTLRYATRILLPLVKKHYPDNQVFKPLDTLDGVLSQIDNITCGLPSPYDLAPIPPIADALKAVNHLLPKGLKVCATCLHYPMPRTSGPCVNCSVYSLWEADISAEEVGKMQCLNCHYRFNKITLEQSKIPLVTYENGEIIHCIHCQERWAKELKTKGDNQ